MNTSPAPPAPLLASQHAATVGAKSGGGSLLLPNKGANEGGRKVRWLYG
jgi:hypothetical protein